MNSGDRGAPRDPALDGLRGVAVLLVVLLHLQNFRPSGVLVPLGPLGPFAGGFLGVDVFFVLSGFLITDRLLHDGGHLRLTLRRFWRARALRLIPALVVLLGVFLAYSVVVGAERRASTVVATVVSAATFTVNWKGAVDINSVAADLGHLWSLSIEEQFYVVWPLLLWALCAGLRFRPRTVLVGLLVAAAGVGVWRAHVFEQLGWLPALVRTDTHCDGLLIGCATALAVQQGWHRHRAVPVVATTGLGVFIAIEVGVHGAADHRLFVGGYSLVALAVATMILGIVGGRWKARRWLSVAPLRVVGRTSYGIYLWHFVVFQMVARHTSAPAFVAMVLGLTLTALLTAASWRYVERPAQALRRRLDRRPPIEPAVGAETRIGRLPATLFGLAGACVVLAAVRHTLAVSSARGADLPHAASLRGLAFMSLRAEPGAAQLLADSLYVGANSSYSTAYRLPSILRMPVLAVRPNLAEWFTPLSLVVGWVTGALVLVHLAARLGRGGRWLGVANLGVAVLAVVGGVVYVAVEDAQRLEGPVWAVVASLGVLAVIERALRDPSPAACVMAGGAALVGGLAHPWIGWVGSVGVAASSTAVWMSRTAGVRRAVSAVVSVAVFTTLFALDLSSGRVPVKPSAVLLAKRRPTPGRAGQLLVQPGCPSMLASTQIDVLRWEPAETPVVDLVVELPSAPRPNATITLIELRGPGPVVRIDLQSDAHRRVRFLPVGMLDAHPGRWVDMDRRSGGLLRITVDLSEGIYSFDSATRRLGTAVAHSPGELADRYPAVSLGEVASQFGVQPAVWPRSDAPDELCREAASAAADLLVPEPAVPGSSGFGELVAVGSCDAVLAGTGDPSDPWDLLDVKSVDVEVTFTADLPRAQRRVLAVSNGTDAANVAVETDGLGRARLRFDLPYISAPGEWFEAVPGDPHHLTVEYLPERNLHVVRWDGRTLTVIDGDTVTTGLTEDNGHAPFWMMPAGFALDDSSQSSIVARVSPVTLPEVCQNGADGAASRVTASPILPTDGTGVVDVDQCRALVTMSPGAPPTPIEIASLRADVHVRTTAQGPFERGLIGISEEGRISVRLEGDGHGRVRVKVAIPFLDTYSDWMSVSPGETVTVDLLAQPWRHSYVVAFEDRRVAAVPFVVPSASSPATSASFELPSIDGESLSDVGLDVVAGPVELSVPWCTALDKHLPKVDPAA